jgi:dihydroflavonol-4-reductase
MTRTVLVSGGSGYIAGYIIRQLVDEGWNVHTTIRNLAKESAVRALLAVDNSKLSFFAADLTNDAGWTEAMAGCSHVVHVASPLPADKPKTDDELIIPARDGALRALRAAKAAGVKRFVMTSSAAAIAYGHGQKVQTFTEADWTNVNSPDAYAYVNPRRLPNAPPATGSRQRARIWNIARSTPQRFLARCGAMISHPRLKR